MDFPDTPRILARVAIVDGKSIIRGSNSHADLIQDAINLYYSEKHPSGFILGDIGIHQLVHGHLRSGGQAETVNDAWLVDIEPVLVRY
jgi:hypothetical protein